MLNANTAKTYDNVSSQVKNDFGDKALAIMMYGSCLSKKTQKTDSVPDYFIIVNDFKSYYGTYFKSFLNTFLSPNIFHFKIEHGFSKYSVVSLKQLTKETSLKAKDMYFLGRFSKSMYCYWYKDDFVLNKLIQIQCKAMINVAKKVLSSMSLGDSIKLDDFILKCIGLSYQGDLRVEAQDKIEKLYFAQKSFYQKTYTDILKQLHDEKIIHFKAKKTSLINNTPLPKHFSYFIYCSKLRSVLRWPKGMITAENWLDYVLLKVKRSYGEEFTLNDKEKKYWYIYGWKLLIKLQRKKMLK